MPRMRLSGMPTATAMAWEQRARAKDWNALLPYAAEREREREEHLEDVRRGLAWSAGVLDMSGVGFNARSVDLVMDLKHAIPPDDAVRIAAVEILPRVETAFAAENGAVGAALACPARTAHTRANPAPPALASRPACDGCHTAL